MVAGGQYESSVATLEDKIFQRAVVEVLNAVYEADFRGFSYGFRPGRGQHDALDALAVGIERKKVNWVLDADIRDFFTSVDRGWLERFLRHRIADERVLRLIGKWLAAGVMEEGVWSEGAGTPQGASAHAPNAIGNPGDGHPPYRVRGRAGGRPSCLGGRGCDAGW